MFRFRGGGDYPPKQNNAQNSDKFSKAFDDDERPRTFLFLTEFETCQLIKTSMPTRLNKESAYIAGN